MTGGMPTFQQTFANCPFPEGVLAVLGNCPVQVRVLRAQRAMEVTASGTGIPQEVLAQASDVLRRVFGLSAATVAVDVPEEKALMLKKEAVPEIPLPEAKPTPIPAEFPAC